MLVFVITFYYKFHSEMCMHVCDGGGGLQTHAATLKKYNFSTVDANISTIKIFFNKKTGEVHSCVVRVHSIS